MSASQGTLPTSGGYDGPAFYPTYANHFNAIAFLIEQIVANNAFVALVQVKSITGGTPNGTPPRVSVQPLVNQIDGLGNQVPHGTIYNIPCFRLQGGNGAIVLDPAVGDIGQAIICDRDISIVKETAAVSGPGSWRQNDWADGCYFGGFLNAAPTQYVGFSSGGISIVTPYAFTISASNATLDAGGNLRVIGEVIRGHGTSDQVALGTHGHPQGPDSRGDTEQETGPPTAGT